MKRSFSKLYSFLSRSSNISLLIDGQNDQIGNWNFTLQKIFHNTYIIRHKISVIINIIGSSGLYSQPKIFSCPNIFPFILYFRCDLSESKVPKSKNLRLGKFLSKRVKCSHGDHHEDRWWWMWRWKILLDNEKFTYNC